MSDTKIKVAVCGAAGRMGREVVRAVGEEPDLALVAAVDRALIGSDSGVLSGSAANGVAIEADLDAALARTSPEVLVDFTLPEGLMANIRSSLKHGTAPVVGTTGLSEADIDEVRSLSHDAQIGVFIAPNFAIGAVLMMKFAEEATRYLPDVEIIELHHDKKLDSPSGTALLTAQRIGSARREAGIWPTLVLTGLVEKAPGARGARAENTGDVPIHSVRLQGFVAHQEVIFGGPGQILTIRHDSIDRKSFMPGVILAIRNARSIYGVVIGLEKLL